MIAFILSIFFAASVIVIPITDWDNPEELAQFLAQDDTDSHIHLVMGADGIVKFHNQCEDTAIQLMNRAQAQGKRLSFVPLNNTEYERWYDKPLEVNRYHAVCGAIVGNEFWYIEPSTDKQWLAAYLD